MATILLVEDDKHQRMMYEEDLKAWGYDVVTAASGREAVAAVEANPKVDLVVMDISMPNMDGIEAMGKILGKNNRIPVILNTAYAQYKDNFLSWAADAYIIKSATDLTELRETIAKILAKRKAN
jgi:CheY-like chemotaxis protein